MQQTYRRMPMSKCDFNKVAKQLYSIKHLDFILQIHFSTLTYKEKAGSQKN